MAFLFKVFVTKIFSLILFGDRAVSFRLYNVEKSLTPLGWAIVLIIPIVLILGTTYLIKKAFRKSKLK